MTNLRFATRRSFLKYLGMTAAGTALQPYLAPTLSFAQASGSGPVEIYIRVFLSGGIDGLFMVPPKSSTLFSALQAARPSIMMSPGLRTANDVLDLGLSFGLHPVFGQSAAMAANGLKGVHQLFLEGRGKILSKIGFPTPNLDHTAATDPWNVGQAVFNQSSSLHWEANLMNQGLEWNQIWALGNPSGNIPLKPPPGRTAPISTRFLNMISQVKYDDYQYGWRQGSELGGSPEVEAAKAAINQILALPDASDTPIPIREYKRGMRDALSVVTDFAPLNAITLPAYFNSSPLPNGIGENFKDIAKIVTKYRVGTTSSWKLLFQVGYLGFDSHEHQVSGILPLLEALNHAIGTLERYLSEQGLWAKTVIQLCGEFGRDISENGKAGTGHGHGSMHLMVGGALASATGVVAGGAGLLPSFADLSAPPRVGDSRILTTVTDPRRVYWEVISAMGLDPSVVLTDMPTTTQNLRLFG